MIGPQVRELDLNLLVVLEALLEERSVTRAAARLGRTQSAVSRSLARLRRVFADPLFVRVGTQLSPTPRAEAVQAPLKQLLVDLEARVLVLERFEPAISARTFTLATADYVAAPLLPRLVARIEREAPSVKLQVVAAARAVSEMVEAAELVVAPRAEGSVRSRLLFTDPFVCILRADHPVQSLDLQQFVALRHVLVAPSGAPGGIVDDALSALGRSRTVSVQVHGFSVAPSVVASSDLVCTLPLSVARRGAEQHALRLLPPPLPLPTIRVHLCWHERWQHDPGHAWLRTRICEAMEGWDVLVQGAPGTHTDAS